MNQPKRERTPSTQATLLALAVMVLLAMGFLFLTSLVLPSLLGLFVVVFGFVFLAVFHYVTWGWWLKPRLERQIREAAEEPEEA